MAVVVIELTCWCGELDDRVGECIDSHVDDFRCDIDRCASNGPAQLVAATPSTHYVTGARGER